MNQSLVVSQANGRAAFQWNSKCTQKMNPKLMFYCALAVFIPDEGCASEGKDREALADFEKSKFSGMQRGVWQIIGFFSSIDLVFIYLQISLLSFHSSKKFKVSVNGPTSRLTVFGLQKQDALPNNASRLNCLDLYGHHWIGGIQSLLRRTWTQSAFLKKRQERW